MATPEGTEFKSHPWCEPGFFAFRFDDERARDLLWLYAQRIKKDDVTRSEEIHQALRDTGYDPVNHPTRR